MNSRDLFEETIEYIESNIEEDLNLDGIAFKMSYSKYYFHRLFLSEMGVSVIDYLKRRRILRASDALVSSSFSVTRIAFDFGFNNVDTFTRSFRRYYGITPSKYRQLRHVSVDYLNKENVIMNNYDFNVGVCTVDEKNEAILVMERILELSRIAHKSGLLSIEEAIETDDCKFLKVGISLLLRGIEANRLRNILVNYVKATKLSNFELFIRQLIIEGVTLLHEGTYPWDLRIELSSYFGEDFIDRFYISEVDEDKLNDFFEMPPRDHKDSKLTKELKNMNKRSVQRLLRECDIVVIALASFGIDKSYKKQIFDGMPIGRRSDFLEVVDLVSNVSSSQIIDSHEEIYGAIQRLRLSNELI